MDINPVEKIVFRPDVSRDLVAHCCRKLKKSYLEGEERQAKAFGIIGGRVDGMVVTAERVIELKKNVRNVEPYRQAMDRYMDKYAVPSETPLAGRGWVADPEELRRAVSLLKAQGVRLIGTYHMHRVAWENDPRRDTPTLLDTILGRDSRLLMFIVSMVDPESPIIRIFKEGDPEREIPVAALMAS